MTREQIEKEARGYISDVYAGDGYFLPDYEEEVRDGFIVGAQWRINSVWHDARKDVPKEFIPILVERDDFTFSVNMVGGNMTSCPLHWVHWAYVIDLLPERKEETK